MDGYRVALEGVAVLLRVARGRVGARHAEEVAQMSIPPFVPPTNPSTETDILRTSFLTAR